MTVIFPDDTNANITKIPADEITLDGQPGDFIYDIELNEELILRLDETAAEDLYNALAIYFG